MGFHKCFGKRNMMGKKECFGEYGNFRCEHCHLGEKCLQKSLARNVANDSEKEKHDI